MILSYSLRHSSSLHFFSSFWIWWLPPIAFNPFQTLLPFQTPLIAFRKKSFIYLLFSLYFLINWFYNYFYSIFISYYPSIYWVVAILYTLPLLFEFDGYLLLHSNPFTFSNTMFSFLNIFEGLPSFYFIIILIFIYFNISMFK